MKSEDLSSEFVLFSIFGTPFVRGAVSIKVIMYVVTLLQVVLTEIRKWQQGRCRYLIWNLPLNLCSKVRGVAQSLQVWYNNSFTVQDVFGKLAGFVCLLWGSEVGRKQDGQVWIAL